MTSSLSYSESLHIHCQGLTLIPSSRVHVEVKSHHATISANSVNLISALTADVQALANLTHRGFEHLSPVVLIKQ